VVSTLKGGFDLSSLFSFLRKVSVSVSQKGVHERSKSAVALVLVYGLQGQFVEHERTVSLLLHADSGVEFIPHAFYFESFVIHSDLPEVSFGKRSCSNSLFDSLESTTNLSFAVDLCVTPWHLYPIQR